MKGVRMKSIRNALANFRKYSAQLRQSRNGWRREFRKLFPHARIAILQAIYEGANNEFPYDFDPVKLVKKVKLDGHPIDSDLFWFTLKQFGIREKCSVRGGSFNIDHHSCTGKVPLRMVVPYLDR